MDKEKSFIKETIIVIFGFVFNYGSQAFSRILLGRYFPPSTFGLYSIFYSGFVLLETITVLGLPVSITRFLPDFLAKKNDKNISYILITTAIFSLFSSLVFCVGLYLTANNFAKQLGNIQLTPILQLLAIMVPSIVIINIGSSILRGSLMIKESVFVRNIMSRGSLLFSVIFGVLISLELNQIIRIQVLLYTLAGIITIFIIRRILMKVSVSDIISFLKDGLHIGKKFLLFSAVIFLSSVLGQLFRQGGVLMLGKFNTSSTAGLYSAGFAIATLLELFYMAGIQVYIPRMSAILEENSTDDLAVFHEFITKFILFLSVPVAIVLIFFAYQITMFIYGVNYIESVSIIIIIVFGIIIRIIFGPLESYLVVLDKKNLVLLNNIIVSVIFFILGIILIPSFGGKGAAIAYSVGLAVRALAGALELRILGYLVLLKRHYVVSIMSSSCIIAFFYLIAYRYYEATGTWFIILNAITSLLLVWLLIWKIAMKENERQIAYSILDTWKERIQNA